MTDHPSLEEFTQALEELPPEFKAQLTRVLHPGAEIDTLTVKFDLVKFVTELQKHNQAAEWEINKLKPRKIDVEGIIKDSQKLFDFIVG
tara:strand:- start:255 stop:521 length:267 start_codon:yes stop_codon:yes gene_type:complete